jgi:hypothetical protein
MRGVVLAAAVTGAAQEFAASRDEVLMLVFLPASTPTSGR